MPYQSELDVALSAIRLAGDAALQYFRTGLVADNKADDSPVTAADRHCERIIVQNLCAQFPDDGLLGEEGADKPASAGRRWIIDPIDGTRDFVRGNRNWSMLLALEDAGEVVVGVAHFPALGETYYATRGGGAFRNGEPIRISAITTVEESTIFVNTLNRVHAFPWARTLIDWLKPFWSVRSMSGALDAMCVASGAGEAWIEPTCKPWDLAPLKLIAEEAGARFFTFNGGDSIYDGNCVICVPALETTMRRFVAG